MENKPSISDKVVVKVDHFNYWYPQCSEPTLIDLNFEIREGELVLLAGRSGCGKSTLAYCLMGIRPEMLLGRAEGNLIINGNLIQGLPLHKNAKDINIVFQSPDDQITNLTVEDEIVFGLENRQTVRSVMQEKLEEVLDVCHLTKLRYRHVWDLSGGEKQRVAMASIIALEPPIIILDEPTSNLDPRGELEVWEAVERIRQTYGATIILVQHNIDAVLCKVDRVLLMDKGSICFDGTSIDLVSSYRWRLRDEWGMWLPQATEVGLSLEDRGRNISCIPIGIEQAGTILENYCKCHNLEKYKEFESSVTQSSKNHYSEKPIRKNDDHDDAWLNVKNLRFSYRKQSDEVLKGVSFSVQKGENLAILGPNGAGKSTLAMGLIGLLKPSSGSIFINNEDTRYMTPAQLARKIAYVFQYPEHQFICNSVYSEMTHGLKAIGMPEDEVEQKVEDMLRHMNLWGHKDRHPFNLSMGQKRRLSVACMLIMDPQAIILDEPTFGQDWINATELMEYLDVLNKNGTTTMIITHNMRLVAQYAKRAMVLVNGQIIYDNSPIELFADKAILSNAALMPPPIFEIAEHLNLERTLNVKDLCDELIANFGE